MKNIFKIIGIIILLIACYIIYYMLNMAPQGHGSKAEYYFNEPKFDLENKIDSFLNYDTNVNRLELLSPPNDNYYNEGAYFTITIDSINYCFRYYGDSLDWVNSKDSSMIFIASIKTIGKKKMTEVEKINIVEDKFINKLRND